MEHGWAWWWLIPMLMFFWWGPWAHRRRHWQRDDRHERARVAELDEEIRARLATVDQLETRVAELENRLDFTERLLSEGRTAGRPS
ncbi:MAG TPA: hypothetical protein VFU46_11405 [Gemmatimonadales bacterium]|nr:hypothetical protein [Gemmatimonadales bacterium]